MNNNRKLNAKETTALILFLLYSFAIAWGAEFILIFLYKMDFITGSFAQLFHFGVIGFGAGMAPAYAAFIVMKKQNNVTLKGFGKKIFQTKDCKKSFFILILFAVIQFLACFLLESYSGYPCYFFILFMPMMILGGGLEEIGWQGVFQPLLQKRFPFLAAAIIEGDGMERLAYSSVACSEYCAERLQLCGIYAVLHYLRNDAGSRTQTDKQHLGFRPATRMGEYRLGRDVQPDFPVQFPKLENTACQRYADFIGTGRAGSFICPSTNQRSLTLEGHTGLPSFS